MFHLTRYRYLFFAISGIIIVPGLLALIFLHLNLGIDFTSGSTVDLRFQAKSVDPNAVAQTFKAAGAQDINVQVAKAFGNSVQANQYVFIEFSRPIGPNFENQVLTLLTDPKAKLPAVHQDSTGKPAFANITDTFTTANGPRGQIVVFFDKPVKAADVSAALKNLPQTDAPAGTTGTGNGNVTSATPSATTSPSASATTAPTATPKPGATATPAPTATPTPAQQTTFPVSIVSLVNGENIQTYTVNTQSDLVNTPQATSKGPSLEKIVDQLRQKYGPAYIEQSSSINPTIAGEQTLMAILAVAAASVFILLYIAFAFRRVGSLQLALRFGASAIIALLHDAFVVLGLWAIFGALFNFKVDTLFVTAVLTVIGFSVHDTIVVFDRIRENLARHTVESFNTVVDTSLIQTLSRSLNTSLTVLFVLSAQALFGGASTREFVLALLIGIASGTYSSIFNASMILSVWENHEYRYWFRNHGKPGALPRSQTRSPELAGTRV